LSCIKINYDFNHQNGSHRASFKIRENSVHAFESDGYYARVEQTFIREDNTLSEILENPALLSTPKLTEVNWNTPFHQRQCLEPRWMLGYSTVLYFVS
jgi:hypothetical protein